jgi:hypothetical protein
MGQGVGGYCEHLPYYKVVDPDAEHIRQYMQDIDSFLSIFEENVDFKIKDVLNKRNVKRKCGITVESEDERMALALYKIACRLAKDWESWWLGGS